MKMGNVTVPLALTPLSWPGPLPLEHCHPEWVEEHRGQSHGFSAKLSGIQVAAAPFTTWVVLGKLLTLSVHQHSHLKSKNNLGVLLQGYRKDKSICDT